MGFETQSVCSNERCQYGTVLYNYAIYRYMYLSDDDIFYVDTCSRYDYCYFMNLSFLLYLKRCKFYLKLLHEEGQIIMARFKQY